MPGYDADLAAIHASGFTGIAEAATRELLERLPRPARVLDLGCGDGSSAELLTEAGHRVYGIDLSPAMVELAGRRVPSASFEVGSFLDARFPERCDAVLAVGEVLGYRLDPRVEPVSLRMALERIHAALVPGGLLLFDLAAPERGRHEKRRWTEGDGWTVLVDTEAGASHLTRRIVTFRRVEGDRFRRSEETHTLHLHAPADVLATLRLVGFAGQELFGGYPGLDLPPGLHVYLGRREP